jgi:hypothetical protein
MKKRTVFRSARIFDGESETLRTGQNVVFEGEDISILGSGVDRLSIIMKDGCFHKRTI